MPALHDSHQRANNFSQNEGVLLSQGTLMFIANQGEVRQNSYPARPYAQQNRPQRVLGPCYGCNGDHLLRDCPLKTNEVVNNTPQMAQHPNTNTNTKQCDHCDECGVKHLFQDCP